MSQLKALKSATSLSEVAHLLGYKASALSFILYRIDEGSRYTTFEIPKRYGGTRKISAPMPELKLLQRHLSDLLQNCAEEINAAKGVKDQIAHGFKRQRSIITNAVQHRHRRYVFNLDLHNFFGTINFGRVRGFFLKDKNFMLHEKVATILAQIACHENSLPQGSPCSPVISNLIGHVLDIHLVRLAWRAGCVYTRYADDLTFSTNLREFPRRLAERIEAQGHKWVPGKELERLIKLSGFEVNPSKTRMQYRSSRQEVTGLVVNRKVNVRYEYRHRVRAMVHRLFTTGDFAFEHSVVDDKGTVTVTSAAGTKNQLHGMLGFIDGVDLYNRSISPLLPIGRSLSLTSKESMYRRFLLFKEFYAAPMPVIVCEGKTDNVYLLHAIRRLASGFPQLATTNADGSIKLEVRIYKYSETSTGRILGITGGSSSLARFMSVYRSESKRFSAPGNQQPIIILIDNDDGASSVYSVVKEITKVKPTGAEPFIHVVGNLYLVATPLPAGCTQSMIEDFFEPSVTSVLIGGKTFDPKNDTDTDSHYSKVVFAHKVVRPNADAIDFKGFTGILSRFVAVIEDHAKRLAV